MKPYFSLLFFLFVFDLSASQEMKRVNSIVDDIVTLRKNYEKQVEDLKAKNNYYEDEIKNLKSEIKELKKSKKRVKIVKEVCKNENQFPKLKIDKRFFSFDASAFRLRNDAPIYEDEESDKIIARWEKGTSFTSHIATQKRVKITGYFVNRIWKKADKDMWIDRHDIIKR
jgi:cell division protein FtsB